MEDKLIKIIQDFHWMARRYVDGRMSYVTSLFNRHVSTLRHMDIYLDPYIDGSIWARDGMGRAYDGLTDEEAEINHLQKLKDNHSKLIVAAQKVLDWNYDNGHSSEECEVLRNLECVVKENLK